VLHKNILWLEVGVDNVTSVVEEMEGFAQLVRKVAYCRHETHDNEEGSSSNISTSTLPVATGMPR
jgi:hypothetical protein